jgi:WD40 repeat protein
MSTVMDPAVAQWLEEGPRQGPPAGLDRALSATRQIEQRPRFVFVSGWLPRTAGAHRRPAIGLVPVLIILLTLLLLALSAVYVGTQQRRLIQQSIGPSAQSPIAYTDGTQISVARIDGTGRRVISGDLPRTSSPVFSKDGSKIAFLSKANASDAGRELYVVPFDGSSQPVVVSGLVQVLEADTPEFSWSPDGSRIAFASAGSPNRIYVAESDGSAVTPVTNDTNSDDLPSWETNGNRVAYRSIQPDGVTQTLEAIDPTTGEVTRIDAVFSPGAQMSRLAWSPAEDKHAHAVSYVDQMADGAKPQAVINFTDPTVTTTSGVLYPWTDGVGGYQTFGTRWSPDGQWIAIITASDGVVLAQNAGMGPATIYNSQYNGQVRHLGDVADCWIDWSPDGTALYGGSPDGCAGTVVIPVADPGSAFTTYTPMSGVTSWQPTAQ